MSWSFVQRLHILQYCDLHVTSIKLDLIIHGKVWRTVSPSWDATVDFHRSRQICTLILHPNGYWMVPWWTKLDPPPPSPPPSPHACYTHAPNVNTLYPVEQWAWIFAIMICSLTPNHSPYDGRHLPTVIKLQAGAHPIVHRFASPLEFKETFTESFFPFNSLESPACSSTHLHINWNMTTHVSTSGLYAFSSDSALLLRFTAPVLQNQSGNGWPKQLICHCVRRPAVSTPSHM